MRHILVIQNRTEHTLVLPLIIHSQNTNSAWKEKKRRKKSELSTIQYITISIQTCENIQYILQ